jgi:ribosome biogenesis GTPase
MGAGDAVTGFVLSTTNNTATVLCSDGIQRLCGFKGKRIKTLTGQYNSLAAGDRVEVQVMDGERGLVASLEPRKNAFGRYNEKGRAEQAIASNIDRVICVSSPLLPPFRPRFIDRLAVMAEVAQTPFIIFLNKIELGIPGEVAERLEDYERLGYRIILGSAKTGQGVEELRTLVSRGASVLAGQSGVGKSTLMNALVPGLDRRTQDVSEKYQRGKHTTTMAQAIVMDGSAVLIDTPGIRRLALRSIEPQALASLFPEMRDFIGQCSLGSRCSHGDEEGCQIREAVKEGTIHADRYESYLRIRQELDLPQEWKRSGVRDPGRKERSSGENWKRKVKRFDMSDLEED